MIKLNYNSNMQKIIQSDSSDKSDSGVQSLQWTFSAQCAGLSLATGIYMQNVITTEERKASGYKGSNPSKTNNNYYHYQFNCIFVFIMNYSNTVNSREY